MPKIDIQAQSQHPGEKTIQLLEELFKSDRDLKNIDADYTTEFDEKSLTGKVKGSKFDVAVKVEGSTINIQVEIPFMLSPFKNQIKSKLEGKLHEAFGS